MIRFALGFLLIGALALGSYATSVSVTTSAYATDSGVLTNLYFESAAASGSTTPSSVTLTSQPSATGSTSIGKGSTVYLYSTQFAGAKSTPAGQWVVCVWAALSKTATLSISVTITDSSGSVQTTVGSASTPSLGTTEGEASVSFAGASAGIPAGGYIRVSISTPPGTSGTLYWGKAQGTNFQVPMSIESS